MGLRNARTEYADIIDLPHHQSKTRKHMSMHDRAAQFSPFAALSGYDELVTEEARTTEEMIVLEDGDKDEIGRTLAEIDDRIRNGEQPEAVITYFVPDEKKAGGAYVTAKERIKRIDAINQKIVLVKCTEIGHVNLTIDFNKLAGIREAE